MVGCGRSRRLYQAMDTWTLPLRGSGGFPKAKALSKSPRGTFLAARGRLTGASTVCLWMRFFAMQFGLTETSIRGGLTSLTALRIVSAGRIYPSSAFPSTRTDSRFSLPKRVQSPTSWSLDHNFAALIIRYVLPTSPARPPQQYGPTTSPPLLTLLQRPISISPYQQ